MYVAFKNPLDEPCLGCGKKDDEPNFLLCDVCDYGAHFYCLDPPLAEVPIDNWICPKCSGFYKSNSVCFIFFFFSFFL